MTVAAHIDLDHWAELESALKQAREKRQLPQDFTFHFSDSRDEVREAFFKELARVPFRAHALLMDKQLWPAAYIKATSGPGRIQDQIGILIVQCPDELIGEQTLLIDGPKLRGGKQLPSLKTELNRRLAACERRGLRKVRFCPDHQLSQGLIVQVADMIAGALNDAGTIDEPYLSLVRSKITLV